MPMRRFAHLLASALVCFFLLGRDAAAPVAAQAPADGDPRFGLVLVPPREPWLGLAYAAGARTIRYQVNWWDVEPSPGLFDWRETDAAIRAYRNAGFEVSVIVHAPPPWARLVGYKWVPNNLDRPWDDPANFWGRFVFAVAERYRGQVASYEIFNEPDLAIYWDGSPAQYAQLLAVAARAIRAADPNATIIMAGMAHWVNPGFAEGVLQALHTMPDAAQNGFFFDISAWHWYTHPDNLTTRTEWVRDLLARYGMGDKPIWVNETNLPVWGIGGHPVTPMRGYGTPAQQAAFIVQAFTNAFAAGVERVFVFRLDDSDMDERFGLVSNDGVIRPGYTAYATTARWLSHARFVSREQVGDLLITTFRRGNDEHIRVIWNTAPQPVAVWVPAVAAQATLSTPDGRELRLTAQPGAGYLLTFDAATALPEESQPTIGGSPIFLVERATDPSRPLVEMQPLPALSASTAITLTWHASHPGNVPIVAYEVEVRADDGAWVRYTSTTEPRAVVRGESGHRYGFRVIAVDANGNRSLVPPNDTPMAETFIGARLFGRLVDFADRPLPHEPVCLRTACTLTDANGAFAFDTVLAGRHLLEAPSLGVRRVLTLENGQTTDLGALTPPLKGGWLRDSDFEHPDDAWTASTDRPYRLRVPNVGMVLHMPGGSSIGQRLTIPAEAHEPLLRMRYRSERGRVRVSILPLDGGRRAPVVVFEGSGTAGEWRTIVHPLSAWRGTPLLLSVSAPDVGTLVQIDWLWVGENVRPQHHFLPLVVR